MRPIVHLIAICLLALLQLPVRACAPPPPDPWFITRLMAGPAALPPEVTMEVRDHGASIAFKNNSETPLYVLGNYGYNADVEADLPRDTPTDYSPNHKLEREQLYHIPVDRPNIWERAQGVRELELRLGWGKLYGHGPTPILAFPSRYKEGDDRPADVDVPASHQLELLLAYGDQLITVPLTVSYLLNADYDPRSVAKAQADDCDSLIVEDNARSKSWWFLGLGVLAGILVTFAYFRRGQPAPS